MNKIITFLTILILMVISLSPSPAYSAGGNGGKKKLNKTQGTPNNTKLNINNISTWFYNSGDSDLDPSGNSGFNYPKGSGKTAVFESGFIWGAKVNGETRVGGSTYSSGLQAGKITAPGQAEDPDAPKNRIYRVRRDYKTGSVATEAREEGVGEDAVRQQYQTDWDEWPATDGAPFEDVDGDGTYNPAVDIPGVPGASQTIWFVANDLNASLTTKLYGSNPMGIEMQATYWAYARGGALGNVIFRKYLIINKSTTPFTDMYVSMWSDPDVGDASNDFAGCDTVLSLGYAYNADPTDATYDPLPPPAVGFDFFQGPIVDAPGDSAIFGGKRVFGKRNLPMTAFYYFARGELSVTDPTLASYEGTLQFYNFMQGRIGKSGEIFRTPEGVPTTYAVSGDPITGQGWIDGTLIPADDRRIGLASGPFTMAVGDTQEIVVAQIAAGAERTTDRLEAIALLKTYDAKAQEAYDNFFQIPSGAPAPIVTATPLDREVVLSWGDPTAAEATESYDARGFKFQGYNVYQLRSATDIASAQLIATYDLQDTVGVIYDLVSNAQTGKPEVTPVQFGTNSGIQRSIRINKDFINGGVNLNNGSRYYFAVTSYSYSPNPTEVPNVLENPIATVTVVPHSEDPGTRYNNAFGDTLPNVQHVAGTSNGSVVPVVVDPSQLTTFTYSVSFDTMTTQKNYTVKDSLGRDSSYTVDTLVTYWTLVRGDNDTLMTKQLNQSGDEDYLIVDGMKVKVLGPQNDFLNFQVVANANGPLATPEGGAFDFGNFPSERPTDAQQVGAGIWGIHTADNGGTGGGGTRADYTAFIDRVTRGGANWPEIIPYDFEMRFTGSYANPGVGGSYGFTAFADTGKAMWVPFELWNIGIATPDDPSDDYKLVPYILDEEGTGTFNLESWGDTTTGGGDLEHSVSGGIDDPYTDWVYWYRPENTTPGTAGYDAAAAEMLAGTYTGERESEVMARIVLVNWNGGAAPPFNQDLPEQGTIFRIQSNKPNRIGDVFSFTAPGVVSNTEFAKEDVKKINVFPNPYYGVNPQELNKYQRFVTFNHLPNKAKIRIFNLAGQLVRVIDKDSRSQFETWDLANQDGLPVASGLYIAHIDMDQLGTKILKLAIIQEQQILDRY